MLENKGVMDLSECLMSPVICTKTLAKRDDDVVVDDDDVNEINHD